MKNTRLDRETKRLNVARRATWRGAPRARKTGFSRRLAFPRWTTKQQQQQKSTFLKPTRDSRALEDVGDPNAACSWRWSSRETPTTTAPQTRTATFWREG